MSPRIARPLALILLACRVAWADEPKAADLPRGPGISAKYHGDRGIADDPAVLLAEGFEAGDLDAVKARWDEASDRDGRVLRLADDVPFPDAADRAGRRSLRLEAHPGEDDGGHLYARLPRAVDRAFVRFYVKFPEPANYIHHFVHFGGYNPPTTWPQGGAGERPAGDERITVGIEPFGDSGRLEPPGAWNFYAYWHEMKRSADGRSWGNGIGPSRRLIVPEGRWQCVEMMVQLNTPGERDGELALWLDGEPALRVARGTRRGDWTGLGFEVREGEAEAEPFEGFSFRTTDDLKLNFLWLLHYVTETNQSRNRVDDPKRPTVVLFDHVVVATEYVGPVELP